jgi:hypothetical protein
MGFPSTQTIRAPEQSGALFFRLQVHSLEVPAASEEAFIVMVRRLPRLAAIIACLAAPMAPAPAVAQTTPAADYGPVTACIGGYALAAREAEAVILMAPYGGLTLMNDSLGSLEAIPDAGPDDRRFKVSSMTIAGPGLVRRYDYPTQAAFRAGIPGEVVGYTEQRHTEYVLPAVGGAPPLRITSSGFTGGVGDRAVLQRFSARSEATRCDPLKGDPDGKWVQDVTRWSPVRLPGPAFICRNGLGFAILADEHLTHTWAAGPDGVSFPRITGTGYEVSIFGARVPQGRGKPMGGLLAMGYRVDRTATGATLWPPAAYPRDPNDNGLVYINAAGLDDAALTRVLQRLEYVRATDRRCRT